MTFTVALVGRPNVGKSTLFNRLSIQKKAITHNEPGVTRDRKYEAAKLGPVNFTVVDTPGMEKAKENSLEHSMTEQTMTAIKMADLVCLVVDSKVGIIPEDKAFAGEIRKYAKECILLINKCEKPVDMDNDYYKLGFMEMIPISAEHGHGMASFCESLIRYEDKYLEEDQGDKLNDDIKNKLKIAVVGRPNSGKSTFINALLQEQRLLTGAQAGITRDSIEVELEYKNQKFALIDTAGLRKKANVSKQLEKLSTQDTMYTVRFANTVILMLDCSRPLEHQDLNIANYIIKEGRSLIIAFNKWDLVENSKEFKEEIDYQLKIHLPQIKDVPHIFISSTKSENIHEAIDLCMEIYKIWNKKISTSKLNEWLGFALNNHQPPLLKNGRRLRVKYCTQIKTRPPTFKFFCNNIDSIPESYKKYLLNELRADFDLPGVPIRIYYNITNNPYKK